MKIRDVMTTEASRKDVKELTQESKTRSLFIQGGKRYGENRLVLRKFFHNKTRAKEEEEVACQDCPYLIIQARLEGRTSDEFYPF